MRQDTPAATKFHDDSCFHSWLVNVFEDPLDRKSFEGGTPDTYTGGDVLSSSPPPSDKDLEDAESVIIKEMNAMNLKERERCYEDIHAVAPAPPKETPEFLQTHLEDMAVELVLINDKEAYELAHQLSPKYVEDEKLRLKFLQAESFDVAKAAHRFVGWFQLKLELFGREKLCTDITLNDLSPEDGFTSLESGRAQVLPTRDRGGRTVVMDMVNFHKELFVSVQALLENFYYITMSVQEDEDTQRTGVVVVFYVDGFRADFSASMRELNWKAAQMSRVLPFKLVGFHLCVDHNPTMEALSNFLKLSLGPKVRHRFKSHFGSRLENHYAMLTYGIPVAEIPVTTDGKLRTDQHKKWIESRRRKELALKNGAPAEKDVANLSPLDSDVLCGRGRPYQVHPGNVTLKKLIQANFDEYNQSSKKDKTELAKAIVRIVHERHGGRFLKKNGDEGWVEASFLEARDKVAHGFRKLREMESLPQKMESSTEGNKRIRVL